ncbi:MAG: hypothetical protein JSW72_02705 [Candidatus Bathyarchaeota archaeon]|nr:MAG: hypothetical protein JSW72_02705 [Candidatus Bathyarchaeota archaeon]
MAKEKEETVLMFDKPYFVVKLSEYVLEVDVKGGFKEELEDFLEKKPAIARSLGFIFETLVPIDVWLKDIESVVVDKDGATKIVIPHHRDITIPLAPDESKRLVSKLEELIPIAKEKAIEEAEISRKLHINL